MASESAWSKTSPRVPGMYLFRHRRAPQMPMAVAVYYDAGYLIGRTAGGALGDLEQWDGEWQSSDPDVVLVPIQSAWTSSKPTAPGVYLARDSFPPSSAAIVVVFEQAGELVCRFAGLHLVHNLRGVSDLTEWQGPLEPNP